MQSFPLATAAAFSSTWSPQIGYSSQVSYTYDEGATKARIGVCLNLRVEETNK